MTAKGKEKRKPEARLSLIEEPKVKIYRYSNDFLFLTTSYDNALDT